MNPARPSPAPLLPVLALLGLANLTAAGCRAPLEVDPDGPAPATAEAPAPPAARGAAPPAMPPTTATSGRLDRLFEAAARDEGLPELIAEASARIEQAGPGEAHALAERLEPYCRRLFFGPADVTGMEALGIRRHAVAEGEYPYRIAEIYGIDHELIARLNPDRDPTRLAVRDRLRVLDLRDAELELVVHAVEDRCALWRRSPTDGPHPDRRLLLAYVPLDVSDAPPRLRSGASQVVRAIRDTSAGGGAGVRRIDLDAEPFDRRELVIREARTGARDDGALSMPADPLDRLLSVVREGVPVRVVGDGM